MSGAGEGERPLRRVAVFDLDRTITRLPSYTPFLLSTLRGRPLSQLSACAATLPWLLGYLLKTVSRAAVKERMLRLTLAGQPREEVEKQARRFVTAWLEGGLRPAARDVCTRHSKAGDQLMLATASFDFYAGLFAEGLGFDSLVATLSSWSPEGRLLARLDGANCYGEEKLRRVQKALPWPRETCYVIAYSDHHSDLPLLGWADEGVAVNPSRRLAEAAKAQGLRIADWDRPDDEGY
ncbi:MAG: HAD-IB family hydrolase [Rhodovibrionaceae bacterium]